MALTTITIRVAANTAGVASSFADVTVSAQDMEKGVSESMDGIGAKAVALGNIFSDLAEAAVGAIGKIVGAIGDVVKTAAQFDTAILGLQTTARAWGQSADDATAAAQKLAADGLLPLNVAADSLKRVIGTGFNLQQSVDIMNAFKDSAAFARSSTYGFADSVNMAAEALQKHRSRGIQTVGLMETLTNAMKDAGLKVTDLDNATLSAEAHQVAYNAILRLAATAHGDAARYALTYNGAVQALESAHKSLSAEVGTYITRSESVAIVLRDVATWTRNLTDYLSKNKEGFNLVSDALILFTKGLSAVLASFDLLQTGFQGLRVTMDKTAQTAAKGAELIFRALADTGAVMAAFATDPIVSKQAINGMSAALDAIGFLKTGVVGLDLDIHDATATSIDWGNKIQAAKAQVDTLTKQLEASRGKMVAFGTAGDDAGHTFGDAIDKSKSVVDVFEKSLEKLADEIDLANNNNTSLTDKLKLFGPAAAEAALKAKAYGIDIDAVALSVSDLATAQQDVNLDKIFDKAELAEVKAAIKFVDDEIKATAKDWAEFDKEGTAAAKAVQKEIDAVGKKIDKLATHQGLSEFDQAFVDLARKLPERLTSAIESGKSIWQATATTFAEEFGSIFEARMKKAMAKAGADGKVAVDGATKALGDAFAALEGALAGFSTGQSTGSKAKGIGAGVATGALTGASIGFLAGGPVGAGVGAAIGAGAGLIGGLIGGVLGGQSAFDKSMTDLRTAKENWITAAGGLDKLQASADAAGTEMQAVNKDITDALNAQTITNFNAAVTQMNADLQASKDILTALGAAVTAVNTRTAQFAAPFQALVDEMATAQKVLDSTTASPTERSDATATITKDLAAMSAQAEVSQGAFEHLGLYVRDTFAGLVKAGSTAYDAITQLAPSFQVLQDGVTKFGLTSTPVIDSLLQDFSLMNDVNFKPLFDEIESTGQILKSLSAANALSPDTFQAAAADIGHSIQGIIDKGGDAARTLALSQPVLQSLWEAEQKYGTITDDTTQSILDQAVQQGLVGENMKDVNGQILDVLLAIAQVLGADIPDGLQGLIKPAQDAAAGIENAFNGIDVKPINIKVNYDTPGAPPPDTPGMAYPTGTAGPPVVALAGGGIVQRRTLALVGEAGPEAVIPLTGAGLSLRRDITVNLNASGRRLAQVVVPEIPGVVTSKGLNR